MHPLTETDWALSSEEASGIFVLWGGWGERKRKRAGNHGKGKEKREFPPFPSSHRPRRSFYFSIIAILIGIPSGSLCGGESWWSLKGLFQLSSLWMISCGVTIQMEPIRWYFHIVTFVFQRFKQRNWEFLPTGEFSHFKNGSYIKKWMDLNTCNNKAFTWLFCTTQGMHVRKSYLFLSVSSKNSVVVCGSTRAENKTFIVNYTIVHFISLRHRTRVKRD